MSAFTVYSLPSAHDFETWLRYGRKPGEQIVYHVGCLMEDRQKSEAINELARAVWRAFEQGRVLLTQKRTRSGNRSRYIATVIA